MFAKDATVLLLKEPKQDTRESAFLLFYTVHALLISQIYLSGYENVAKQGWKINKLL